MHSPRSVTHMECHLKLPNYHLVTNYESRIAYNKLGQLTYQKLLKLYKAHKFVMDYGFIATCTLIHPIIFKLKSGEGVLHSITII